MKILIIEDDRNSACLMEHYMKRYGTCTLAKDGLEAIGCILEAIRRDELYELAIVDIMMPNLNGLDTLQKIREIEINHKIPSDKFLKSIVVSALDGDTVRIESYQLGCLAYLRKPVDFMKLDSIMTDEFTDTAKSTVQSLEEVDLEF